MDRVCLPVSIELLVAEDHLSEPLLSPLIQIGRLDTGKGRAEGAMGSGAVGAEEDSIIQRGP